MNAYFQEQRGAVLPILSSRGSHRRPAYSSSSGFRRQTVLALVRSINLWEVGRGVLRVLFISLLVILLEPGAALHLTMMPATSPVNMGRHGHQVP